MITKSKKTSPYLAFLTIVFSLCAAHGQTVPFNTQDIGTVAVTGTTSCATGLVTITGSGASIGTGTADSCQFGYQTLVGNGSVMAEVQSVGTGVTGVMIRQNMSPGSPEIQVVANGSNVTCIARTTANSAGTIIGIAQTSTVPVWVKIVRTGTTYTAYFSPNAVYHYTQAMGTPSATWTTIGSATISTMSGPVLAGVPQCALDNTSKTSTLGCVVVTPGLPWGAQDVGSVGVSGSTAYGTTGQVIVNASGATMGGTGTADSFGYAYQTLNGDGTIIARMISQGGLDSAGVMIRQNTTPGSPMVQITRTTSGAVLDARLAQNTAAVVEGTGSGPNPGIFFMLVRAGNVFTAFTSYTASSGPWTQVGGPVTVPMGTGPVMIGLVECSLVNTTLKTASFDNINVLPLAAQDVGAVGLPGNTSYGFGNCKLTGSGASLGSGGTNDAFQFDYQALNGSGTLMASVNSQASGTDKSGIMLREDTTPGSPMVSLTVTGTTLTFEQRISENAAATVIATGTVPNQALYLELVRSGSNYTAFSSTAGPNGPWTQLGGSVSVYLGPGLVLAGLVECSQSNTATSAATFSSVTLIEKSAPFTANVVMGTATGMTIPSTFMGLSHEWGVSAGAQFMMGMNTGTPSGINTTYQQLLKNLLAYGSGPINIRIGGDSTDVATGNPGPTTCTPFVNLAQAVNVKFELGINLGANSVSLATNQASGYISQMAVVPGSLTALEIGNEPDIYPRNGLRPSTYTMQPDYLNDFATWRNAIDPLLPSGMKLMGPSMGGGMYGTGTPNNIQAFLTANSTYLSLVSEHWYAAPPSPTAPVDTLLGPADGPTFIQPAVQTTQGFSLPFRVGEFGSFSGAGQPGTSNNFSSALWSIDTMFKYANVGVAGMNWENSGNATAAFWFSRTTSGSSYVYKLLAADGSQSVNPLYYGLLFFQQATGHGAKMAPCYLNLLNTSNNITAYETINTSGTPQLVLLNRDETVGGTVSVTMSGYQQATVYRLTAPTFQATHGVTYAGQTFDNTPDGTPQGTQVLEQVHGNNGLFEIPLPITSGVLVVFSN